MRFLRRAACMTAVAVALIAGATPASSQEAAPLTAAAPVGALAEECWATPGNPWPWSTTCIKGPHRYKSQCDMMKARKAEAGHEVRACTWKTWGGASGYFFFYSFHSHF